MTDLMGKRITIDRDAHIIHARPVHLKPPARMMNLGKE